MCLLHVWDMSEVIVRAIEGKKDMKRFVRFNYELYKDCQYAVPDLLEDTLDEFSLEKNPAFDFCDARWFLAERDGKIVGRVVGIVNNRANARWGCRHVRFGWIDFIDDHAVSSALLKAVEDWGRDSGMDTIVGPLGFTDLDPEGMLFEGFDKMSTMPTIYNYAYYNEHMEALGFREDAVWVDRTIYVPKNGHEANQQKFFRVAKMVEQRYGFHVRKFKGKKELRDSGYIKRVFDIINTSYRDLYGYSEMSQRQMDNYAERYLPYLNLDLISVVENREGDPIAVGICMPDLSQAIRKARARLFPFGWWYLLRALYFKLSDVMVLLLIGTLPEYQDSGCVSLIFADIIPAAQRMGFNTAECCPQLETNTKALSVWRNLDSVVYKRRHTWKKSIGPEERI